MNKIPVYKRLLPFTDWLFHYKRENLTGDILAGVIVTIMLIPQSLAYAMLAGLPPEYGLYASIVPLFIYGLLGTSRTLSVGPVAVISLLTATALTPFAAPGSEEYIKLAMLLAAMTGVIQLVLGLIRGGFIASLLSHPVVAGFITGSSLLILVSQLKHILGVKAASGHLPYEAVTNLVQAARDTNLVTLGMGTLAIALLLFFRKPFRKLLQRIGLSENVAQIIARTGPALLVVAGMAAVALFSLDSSYGVKVVGEFPTGLPGLTLPSLDLPVIGSLAPAALAIVLAGYVESVSVGRSLGAKRRQTIEPNQELVALGAANVASGFTGGFPVTGGFSRSVVNFDAGANTGLASMITAVLIAVVTLSLAPLLKSLPQVVLAATVIVAVAGLINFKELLRLWKYSKGDGALMGLTILSVLGLGVEIGIGVGVGASLLLYLARAGRPHMAVLGRVGESEHFRNIKRHEVTTYPGLLLLRVDENLFFANTRNIEDRLLEYVAEQADLKHIVLSFNSVNYVDSSGLESLEALIVRLRDAGVTLHLAEVKGPVMDRFDKVGLTEHLAPGQVFLSTHRAVVALRGDSKPAEPARAA
ncbi:MAG: sulfate permease [Planctomycetes bacterium]|nr:sulfate permease [Planctomycetota bacterium]